MSFLTSLIHLFGAAIVIVASSSTGDQGVFAALLIPITLIAYPGFLILHLIVSAICTTLRRFWTRVGVATLANLICLGGIAMAGKWPPHPDIMLPLAISGQIALTLLAWRIKFRPVHQSRP